MHTGCCRCRKLACVLWDIFKEPAALPAPQQPEIKPAAPTAAQPAIGNTSGATAGSRPVSAAADAATALPAAGTAAGADAAGAAYVVPIQALLLYLCPDRDLFAGISKAVSVVTQAALPGGQVDAQGVLKMCYPLIQPEQAVSVCRAPLTAQQVAAAVAAAAVAGTVPPAVPAPAASSVAGGRDGGGAAGRKGSCPGASVSTGGDHAQAAQAPAAPPSMKPSQLMYGAACERIVTLLLHRYQWVDVYVSALL